MSHCCPHHSHSGDLYATSVTLMVVTTLTAMAAVTTDSAVTAVAFKHCDSDVHFSVTAMCTLV